MGDTADEVEEQWNVIQTQVMPDLRKNNARDSHKEISEFLLVKCDRLDLLKLNTLRLNSGSTAL